MAEAKSTKDDAKPSMEDVEDQIRLIREDIASLTRLLHGLAEDRAETARNAATAEAEALLGKTRDAADQARAEAQDAADAIERYIAARPVQSAVIALVAGLVIGLVSRR